MLVTKEQAEKMLEVAKPLLEWLNNNTYPHCIIEVTSNSVELKESLTRQITDEFIKD